MNHSKISAMPTKSHLHIWGRQLHLKESPNSEELAQRFTGKERDRVSGLDYYPARYRDPDLGGMWISPDMAREFPNLYSYMGNFRNPLNAVDPDGNRPGDIYFFYSNGLPVSDGIAAIDKLNNKLFGDGKSPGFSHVAIEISGGKLFSAMSNGVGSIDKIDAIKNWDNGGLVFRSNINLNIGKLDAFATKSEGGTYFLDGVCSNVVGNALAESGLDVRPLLRLGDNDPYSPSELLDRSQMKQIGIVDGKNAKVIPEN